MDKGAGIAMCCTFGDLTDVQWWRELQLPARTIVGRDGRILARPPSGSPTAAGQAAYAEIAGKTIFSAREAMVAMLRESGDLDGEPKPTTRMANFYERGDKPLEIVSSRQWYIRNGGRDADLRQALIARGDEIDWAPPFMQSRYTNWIDGLNGDWLISRQRFFGVAFPVWYRLDADGNPDYDDPILATEDQLPIDPASQAPAGYDESQRNRAGRVHGRPRRDGHLGDVVAHARRSPDGWETDDDFFERVFPMDLCTHAHEIIRTWMFSRVVRSHYEHGVTPWSHAMISGWVLDPDRKKQSKSKGNAVVPDEILDKFGADAVRWRAAGARPGADSPFDEAQMKVGRRLAMKVLNASKFVLAPDAIGATGADLDAALVQRADRPGDAEPAARRGRRVHPCASRPTTTRPHWRRRRSSSGRSATTTSSWSRSAPTARIGRGRSSRPSRRWRLRCGCSCACSRRSSPYATEEVWSWWQDGSIHRAAWPTADDVRRSASSDPGVLGAAAAAVLAGIRGAKSTAKVSMRTEVTSAIVTGPEASLALAELALTDIRAAGKVSGDLTFDSQTRTDDDHPVDADAELPAESRRESRG